GRRPRAFWRLVNVDNFVQLTLIRTLRRYHKFEVRESAGFLHYLRRILFNLVRDELRRLAREPDTVELLEDAGALAPNALDLMLGREARLRYRKAIATLPARSRVALTSRFEEGATYEEI